MCLRRAIASYDLPLEWAKSKNFAPAASYFPLRFTIRMGEIQKKTRLRRAILSYDLLFRMNEIKKIRACGELFLFINS